MRRVRRFWMGAGGFMVLLLLWVSQSVRSTQVSYQIQKVEGDVRKEENLQTELEYQRDQIVSLDCLEALAKKKLGLVAPRDQDLVMMTLVER